MLESSGFAAWLPEPGSVAAYWVYCMCYGKARFNAGRLEDPTYPEALPFEEWRPLSLAGRAPHGT